MSCRFNVPCCIFLIACIIFYVEGFETRELVFHLGRNDVQVLVPVLLTVLYCTTVLYCIQPEPLSPQATDSEAVAHEVNDVFFSE